VSIFTRTPDELEQAARAIEASAARLRGVAAHLGKQYDRLDRDAWTGPVATISLVTTATYIAQIAMYVDALERLAVAVRRDGIRAREEVAQLRVIEHRVRNVANHVPGLELPPPGDPQWRIVESGLQTLGLL
jgi:hypothetical protein